jgi:hypothetical protein
MHMGKPAARTTTVLPKTVALKSVWERKTVQIATMLKSARLDHSAMVDNALPLPRAMEISAILLMNAQLEVDATATIALL